MKKIKQSEKKLSLKKLQLARINNPGKIFGGTRVQLGLCQDTGNGSNPETGHDTGR